MISLVSFGSLLPSVPISHHSLSPLDDIQCPFSLLNAIRLMLVKLALDMYLHIGSLGDWCLNVFPNHICVGIQSLLSPGLVVIPRLKNPVCPTIYPLLKGIDRFMPFPRALVQKWNSKSLIQDLNLCCHIHLLWHQHRLYASIHRADESAFLLVGQHWCVHV